MKKVKIAHIARPISGVGVYIDLLTKNIDNERFTNIIICNVNEKIIIAKDNSRKEIIRFHANIKRNINLLNDLKAFISIVRILKKEKPDIIHCHSAKAGILGRLAGFLLKIKTYYTPHAYSYLSEEKRIKKKLFMFVEKTISLLPSITIACSESEYKRAINDLSIKKEKVVVWQNSIEEKIKLEDVEVLKKLPKKFICTIGRPSYQKNTELLVEIITKIKSAINDIHLVILGAGQYSPSLKKVKEIIKTNGVKENITIIPWLTRTETLSVLDKSQLYITCSRYEGLPYSLIEALALGKACIGTDVDGNKDLIIDEYNGYLISQGQKDFVNHLFKLLRDKPLLDKMANNSKIHFINNFSIIKNISKLEDIYLS